MSGPKARPHVQEPVRVAIYTRQSVERDANGDFGSIEAQRAAVRSYIDSQRGLGWIPIEETYDDRGISGATTERPALKRLLEDVRAGKIDVVATYKFDRLSRSLLDFTHLLREFDECGVAFVSVTQSFDTSTATGRLLVNMLASFAEFEREIIRERTRDKVRATRRRGLPCGGRPVLGLDIRGGRYVVNENEAKAVRTIFDLYLEIGTITGTLAELRRRGIRNKAWQNRKGTPSGGGEFDKPSLRRLLVDPLYLGKARAIGEIVPSHHAPIVDESVFRQVADRLAEREHQAKQLREHLAPWSALLSGLTHCGRCGAGMGHSTSSRGATKWRYYACRTGMKKGAAACSNRVNAHDLEDFVVSKLKAIGFDRDLLRRVIEQARSQVEARIVDIGTELRGLEAEARQKPSTELNARIEALRAERQSLKRDPPTDEAIATALTSFEVLWAQLNALDRRRLVTLLVSDVVVDTRAGTVNLKLRDQAIQSILAQEGNRATA